MEYFKFFSTGLILIFLSAIVALFFESSVTLAIINAIISLIGFAFLIYGIRLEKKKSWLP